MSQQQRQRDIWNQPQIMKKDFLIIPIYILFQMVVPIIIVFGTLGLTAMITQKPPAQFLYNLSLSIGFVLAQFLVLFIFFAMHKFDIAQVMKRQLHYARNKTLHILLTIIGVVIVMCLLRWLFNMFGIGPTQYERRVEGLFHYPSALCFTMISMVILRPMVEVIIYKHIIIHELSKKWPTAVTIILSIMIETMVHVYDMMSVWEMLPFLIMAFGSTVIYIKSGMNLAAAYLYQAGIQCVLFIIMLFKMLIM
ncbi:CPBP family intramembrane metalloprotease [Staphylococcus warneri]|uniref:CPBP family lipoprotein N-acylation protein LnsB n=1 Tax=Staphylococcus TaxID=1279 RepID=UPI000951C20C|nr:MULTISPECIES: CPBP family lipoprotein N-acylation protein LnsB [Staphylococcus]MBE9429040.1 CPBP family intramembrane metalloprotease [Staphylococcus epidermidis]AXV41535.1 hypothetical protein Ssp1_04370 [Staphylococcus sp. M0911]MCD8804536.1 CPBP family intramembrane metalloprotease [Staphylococcus warneri]MCD8806803.1 CPBP family intramembrane metalloprotease [Staphylococcus warneri]MDU9352585.1 CPBP family intramembrane metalloprotease [Staphylococcus warneri]